MWREAGVMGQGVGQGVLGGRSSAEYRGKVGGKAVAVCSLYTSCVPPRAPHVIRVADLLPLFQMVWIGYMVLPLSPAAAAAPRSRLRAELDGAPAELSVEALEQVGAGGAVGKQDTSYMYKATVKGEGPSEGVACRLLLDCR